MFSTSSEVTAASARAAEGETSEQEAAAAPSENDGYAVVLRPLDVEALGVALDDEHGHAELAEQEGQAQADLAEPDHHHVVPAGKHPPADDGCEPHVAQPGDDTRGEEGGEPERGEHGEGGEHLQPGGAVVDERVGAHGHDRLRRRVESIDERFVERDGQDGGLEQEDEQEPQQA
ncbi:MAG: hypothetical protein MSC31_11705 [Solirubrobacteraceae bacterium MAG38_C4-C5]|nr:hypothetical protein [Candidatus Siliceabacter maunaloa]